MYPRKTKINGKEVLVSEEQMCEYREHMTQKHRVLFLAGLIGIRCGHCGSNELEAQNALLALDSLSHDPITIIITSPGGDLDATLLFYDTIKMIKSPVITIGRFCASGAAILLAAGNERYLFPHAKVMLHLPSGQMSGDAKEWEIQGQQMLNYKNKMVEVLLECGAKKSHRKILADIDRDLWLDPAEAIEYGLADKILTSELWGELLG
ncbi:hypothetical protein LCGC14_0964720 [marine sediment metagenome]|uniref:Endopeptidase Clp n=1 Tax=marine sediment metagenome TaxID=412755 RepID=A0A0F9NZI8_9ZZZZ